jgi:hypothetical protein
MVNVHRSREPYLSLGEIKPSALLAGVIPLVYSMVRCEKHRSFKLDIFLMPHLVQELTSYNYGVTASTSFVPKALYQQSRRQR